MKSALSVSTSPAFGSKFGQSFSHRVFICSLSEISRGKILPAHGAQLGRFYLESDWFQQPAVASCQSKVFSRVIYGRLLHPAIYGSRSWNRRNGELYILNGPPAHWCQISMEMEQTISSIFFMVSSQIYFCFLSE